MMVVKGSKTTTVIKNVVKSSTSGGEGRDDGDGGGKRNCRDIIFIGNLICNAERIIIKPQPEPPVEPPRDLSIRCTQSTSASSIACNQGRSVEEVCADMPETQGCQPLEPPKEPVSPIAEQIPLDPTVRIPQPGDPDYVHPDSVTRVVPDDNPPVEVEVEAEAEAEPTEEEEEEGEGEEEGVAVGAEEEEEEEEVSDDDDGDESEEDGGGDGDGGCEE